MQCSCHLVVDHTQAFVGRWGEWGKCKLGDRSDDLGDRSLPKKRRGAGVDARNS